MSATQVEIADLILMLAAYEGREGTEAAAEDRDSYAYLHCQNAADAILAAGYRKPRTITSAAELDALPFGSVILDPLGLSLHKNEFTGWRASNGARDIPIEMLERGALPATVLFEPEAR